MDVELQDVQWFSLDYVTLSNNTIFTIAQKYPRPYEFDDMVHIAVSYEMDLNKVISTTKMQMWLTIQQHEAQIRSLGQGD